MRLSSLPNEQICKSEEHQVVGITRHKKELIYYTVVEDDLARLLTHHIDETTLNSAVGSLKGGMLEIQRDEAILQSWDCHDVSFRAAIIDCGEEDLPSTKISEPFKEPLACFKPGHVTADIF